ncbi:hypothetical protein [Candidatus Regiella endosymbiont of Tuberolachnus salignus]
MGNALSVCKTLNIKGESYRLKNKRKAGMLPIKTTDIIQAPGIETQQEN